VQHFVERWNEIKHRKVSYLPRNNLGTHLSAFIIV
jgi:hypothetical protein